MADLGRGLLHLMIRPKEKVGAFSIRNRAALTLFLNKRELTH